MIKLPSKPTLDQFIPTCTPFAQIPSLEAEFAERVRTIAASLLTFSATGVDPIENLAQFLRADANFLGVLLALTNLSQEKFLRILTAERFTQEDYETEWSINVVHRKLKNENGFAERVALLFMEGRDNPLLAKQVATFYLDQLSLPANWETAIRDSRVVQTVIRHKLTGEYNDKKGDAIENFLRFELDRIQEVYGVTHEKGQVTLVGKEVDHVLPSRSEPYVLIMTSYMETTSSNQTARANEQSEMFQRVQASNIRYGDKRVFVNFVDGAGWLARRTDLRKLVDGCDYPINLRTLHLLEAIVCKYVPAKYFTKRPRPIVEG